MPLSWPFDIVNVVATANLDPPVRLESISIYFFNSVIYDPDSYPPPVPAYIKTKEMEGKISIFASGKMISVGTKSKDQAINELYYISNKFADIGLSKIKNRPKIVNMVAVVDIQKKIHLKEVSILLKAVYEPKIFSAVRYRMKLPGRSVTASFLIFSTGQIICLGLTNKKDISCAIDNLVTNIRPFIIEK